MVLCAIAIVTFNILFDLSWHIRNHLLLTLFQGARFHFLYLFNSHQVHQVFDFCFGCWISIGWGLERLWVTSPWVIPLEKNENRHSLFTEASTVRNCKLTSTGSRPVPWLLPVAVCTVAAATSYSSVMRFDNRVLWGVWTWFLVSNNTALLILIFFAREGRYPQKLHILLALNFCMGLWVR